MGPETSPERRLRSLTFSMFAGLMVRSSLATIQVQPEDEPDDEFPGLVSLSIDGEGALGTSPSPCASSCLFSCVCPVLTLLLPNGTLEWHPWYPCLQTRWWTQTSTRLL